MFLLPNTSPCQADELGTPLSASFEGFGANESGRLSAQRLHGALKDIGQFRWTTVGSGFYLGYQRRANRAHIMVWGHILDYDNVGVFQWCQLVAL